MIWYMSYAGDPFDVLGVIPTFLSNADARPAAEQIAERYCGGWDAFKGFDMNSDGVLTYPDDPPMRPVAMTILHGEIIRVYPGAWVSIMQPDGSFEVARIDQ